METEKKHITVYSFHDICVACGRPAAPGELLCSACLHLAGQTPIAGVNPGQRKVSRRPVSPQRGDKN